MNPCPALQACAEAHGVRILLAIESGSRAWGFPSRDSDYDVRFLYVRPLAAYLSVDTPRDTIEQPIEETPAGVLDLNGWDIRKALALLARSNAAVIEWLCSPVVYQHDAGALADLQVLAQQAAHRPALAYHYDRLARRTWQPGAEPLRCKSYFYALRPALALAWTQRHGAPPPMDLAALLAGVPVPAAVAGAIEALRARKAEAIEADMTPRLPVLDQWLTDALAECPPRPAPWDQAAALAGADAVFRRLLGA